jgi:hypothetical protein
VGGRGDEGPARRVVGVHLAAGVAYLAVIECPDRPLVDDPAERLIPAQNLAGAEQLADFASRIDQELRRIAPIVVGVLHPKLYGNWTYRDAFRRVSLEAAIMLSANGLGIAYEQVKRDAALKALQIPGKDESRWAAERLGITPPRYWNERSWAFIAAGALAKESCR